MHKLQERFHILNNSMPYDYVLEEMVMAKMHLNTEIDKTKHY